ncbi:MAG TPA: FKBP-type peptidyl-prolyl cis-trans isomerase [Lachnospiraceae bacterium]|nr:FKBP-type peptidyl-prolyl cis-trans isomerase [Lachnospiraceae bacterium]
MKKKEQTDDKNLSLSKQKRLERQKKQKKHKQKILIWKIAGTVLAALVAAGIIFLIVQQIYKAYSKVTPSSEFSAQLTDDGFIEDVTASSQLTLCDYKNITVPLDEVEYTDDEMEQDIQNTLDQHQTLNTESTAEIADGDKVNIDYVGTVDGVEFDGGNSNGEGYDLTIGSGTFIDDFEQQLIGHVVGDNVTVDVTFPDDYSNDTSLAGKDASFAVTINGIYESPAFDDDFVKENLSDYADSADGYRQYLKDTNYQSNLDTWIAQYLVDHTTVKHYPKAYLKNLKATQKYSDQNSYEYMNQLYTSYYGSSVYDSFEDYVGMSEEEYDISLNDTCKSIEKEAMVYQAILETEGLTVTEDDYKAYLTETNGSSDSYDTQVSQYGKGYAMQTMVRVKALEIVEEYAVVE